MKATTVHTIFKRSTFWLAISIVAGLTGNQVSGDESLVSKALGSDELAAAAAVDELRSAGVAGVDTLLAAAPAPDATSRQRWERAIDTVCAQRDCAASGLYWHTDFDLARAAAQSSGRPILSLRLLGRLDQEVSCANSRFFRTVLYPDPRISSLLRQRFVLHWESVRPVPRVTIDYGDGRVLRGTITGNSIHYILDTRGRLVDALPGLYGPGLFGELLGGGEQAARRLARLDDPHYLTALAELHRQALANRSQDLAPLGGLPGVLALAPSARQEPPTARQAGGLSRSKAAVQMPLVRALSRGAWDSQQSPGWTLLADRYRQGWELGAESRRLLKDKHPATGEAASGTIEAFERLVGLDTVRNEFLLHTLVHTWLATPTTIVPDLVAFNDRIYAELFLTPGSDPWLGLMSPETYLALAPARQESTG